MGDMDAQRKTVDAKYAYKFKLMDRKFELEKLKHENRVKEIELRKKTELEITKAKSELGLTNYKLKVKKSKRGSK